MKRVLTILLVMATVSMFGQARKKADKATEEFRYEIECAGIGADGTYLIKVWSYSKKANVAIEQAKKNAVHGVIFKGFTGGARGCNSQKPLAASPSVESQHEEFFKLFFEDGGKYMKYVSVSSDGNVDAGDRMKVGKEYKVGVIVSVMKDALRKDLEAAGVVKGLSSGF